MTRSLTALLDLDATTEEERLPVRAVFHDIQTLRVRQVAVDAGSWLSRREVLVSVDRFDPPTDTVWPLRVSVGDLKDAPDWEASQGGIGLPPLVTGPFGYTFSPMMMAAGLASSVDRGMPDLPDTDERTPVDRADERLSGLERSSDLLEQDAFGPDGRIGPVTDLLFDDDLTIVALIVGQDDPVEMRLDRVRHRAEQGHFVFD